MSTIDSQWGAIPRGGRPQSFLSPRTRIQGYSVGPNLSQLHWNNNIWAASGSFTKILGKHSIKSGGNWRQVLWEAYPASGGLNISALPGFTANPNQQAGAPATGNALASFMLGIPATTSTTTTTTTHAFLHNYGLFVEDTYQTTPKLTVTAGLRWEQPGAFSEEHDIDAVFLPNAPLTLGGISSYTNPLGATVQLKGQAALLNFTAPSFAQGRVAPLEDILAACGGCLSLRFPERHPRGLRHLLLPGGSRSGRPSAKFAHAIRNKQPEYGRSTDRRYRRESISNRNHIRPSAILSKAWITSWEAAFGVAARTSRLAIRNNGTWRLSVRLAAARRQVLPMPGQKERT